MITKIVSCFSKRANGVIIRPAFGLSENGSIPAESEPMTVGLRPVSG
jgi:hypothetical protein